MKRDNRKHEGDTSKRSRGIFIRGGKKEVWTRRKEEGEEQKIKKGSSKKKKKKKTRWTFGRKGKKERKN